MCKDTYWVLILFVIKSYFYVFYLFEPNVQIPVTVAERSKACAVFARSEAGTMGSNPTQGMDI
jgi:hypothetical protein